MIEINLLPEESRIKARRTGKFPLGAEYLLYVIPIALGALIFIHVALGAVIIAENMQLNGLDKNWKGLQPKRELLKTFTSDVGLARELEGRRLAWSDKLNCLSLDLPSGVWFNEITASRKELVLKASAVSLQKDEMKLIKKFIDALKNDARFMKGASSVELGSVQKRQLGGYDVVDFLLTAKLKAK